MPVGYANYGWSPVAGVWYPVFKTPMPRIYHRSLRKSILKQLYNIKSSITPVENLSADSSGENLSGE